MGSVMSTMLALSDEQVVSDLELAARYLRGLSSANDKVGCIGFCSGGRQTLLLAASSDALDAAIDCWGGFITRASPDDITTANRPRPVIDLAPEISCPVLVVVGAEDKNPSPEVAAELKHRVEASGKKIEIRVFEGAGHAFLADYRPTYREQAAFALWPEAVSFLQAHTG
jgi:carboxymethylenebutenolidase